MGQGMGATYPGPQSEARTKLVLQQALLQDPSLAGTCTLGMPQSRTDQAGEEQRKIKLPFTPCPPPQREQGSDRASCPPCYVAQMVLSML